MFLTYNPQPCNFRAIREKKNWGKLCSLYINKIPVWCQSKQPFSWPFAITSEHEKIPQPKESRSSLPSPSEHHRAGLSYLKPRKASSKPLEQWRQNLSNSKETASSKLESSFAWAAASQWSAASRLPCSPQMFIAFDLAPLAAAQQQI